MAYYGFEWRPYVSVGQRRAQAQTKMNALRKKGRRYSARRDRGPQDRQDLLGRRLVRSSGIVQRLCQPFAAWPELCPQRFGLSLGGQPRRNPGQGGRVGTVQHPNPNQDAALEEMERHQSSAAPAKSVRCWNCYRASCPATSCRSSRTAARACSHRPAKSRSSAIAQTGPSCASTSQPYCTASVPVWTRSPSCCSSCGASTTKN